MSSGGNGNGGMSAGGSPTVFKVVAEVSLPHLPNDARFVVQRQRGGSVPDSAIQFYMAWKWKAPSGDYAWKGGGSIQAGQIPDMVEALAKAYKSETGRDLPGLEGCGDGGDGGGGKSKEGRESTGTFADLILLDDKAGKKGGGP